MRVGVAFGACALIGAPVEVRGQDAPDKPAAVRLSATSRARYEAIDGQARAGFNKRDDLLNLRTTILAEYENGPVRIAAELWDSRVYGANGRTPVSTNEVNTLELAQVFVQAKLGGIAGDGTTSVVQAGRSLLNLGSRRLVASDDYRNTTNSYTGVRADFTNRSGWQATAIYTLPQIRRPDDLPALLDNAVARDRESFDLVLWGALASSTKVLRAATIEASFFHFGERDAPGTPTRDRSLNTLSVRVIREPTREAFDFEVEGIGQVGHAAEGTGSTAPRRHVGAWFCHADVGYTFPTAWKPRVSLEYDHASGEGRGERIGRFDTLFGMRRADLAPAGLYNALARTNIASPGVRIEAVPGRRADLFLSYRPMWLASRFDSFSSTGVRDANGRSGSFAGHQLDTRIRYQLIANLRLEADVVVLAKGRFLREAPNAPPGRWTRYVSLNAIATF